jgi:hypothetical protein
MGGSPHSEGGISYFDSLFGVGKDSEVCLNGDGNGSGNAGLPIFKTDARAKRIKDVNSGRLRKKCPRLSLGQAPAMRKGRGLV